MAELCLICEGPADGLDRRVLDKMIAQRFARNVLVIPACGDATVHSVAVHYRERSRSLLPDGTLGKPMDRVLTIEDRNYRTRQAADSSWKPNSVHLIWRRHEVENCLLDCRITAKIFENLRSSVEHWPDSLPTLPSQVDSLMQQLAYPMTENYVGWLTYYKLVGEKRTLADIRFRHPDRKNPLQPARYPGRQAWLDYLHQESARLRADCQKLGLATEFDDAHVDRLYDTNLKTAQSSDFWTSGRYLEDMGGHELMSALLEHLNMSGVSISRDDLETELLQALDQIYAPGFYSPDDFAELSNRLA